MSKEPSDQEEESGTDRKQTRAKSPRPSKPLPSNRVGFPKQLDLLRAWVLASQGGTTAATNKGVAEMVQMDGGTTTTCNAFFFDIGFLRRGDGGIFPGPEVIEYQRAMEWDPDGAGAKLAPALERSWVGQALLPRLALRAIPKQEAMTVLATASSASREYRTQIGLLLQYLETADLITTDGDLVKHGKSATRKHDERHEQTPPEGTKKQEPRSENRREGEVLPPPPPSIGDELSFKAEVKVSLAEMSGWTPERIQAFFQGIASVLAAKSGLDKKEQ